MQFAARLQPCSPVDRLDRGHAHKKCTSGQYKSLWCSNCIGDTAIKKIKNNNNNSIMNVYKLDYAHAHKRCTLGQGHDDALGSCPRKVYFGTAHDDALESCPRKVYFGTGPRRRTGVMPTKGVLWDSTRRCTGVIPTKGVLWDKMTTMHRGHDHRRCTLGQKTCRAVTTHSHWAKET